MSDDLPIRGGLIVDGLGGQPYVGDVAVRDGVIVAVGTAAESSTRATDADGLLAVPTSPRPGCLIRGRRPEPVS
mgnify:FL=1